jgi:cytidylate kinase
VINAFAFDNHPGDLLVLQNVLLSNHQTLDMHLIIRTNDITKQISEIALQLEIRKWKLGQLSKFSEHMCDSE